MLGEPTCLKVISRLGRLYDEALDGRNLDPNRPFGILVVGSFVKHEPAVAP